MSASAFLPPLQAAERWTGVCNDAQRFLQPQ
jgi:hypothetical protein